MTITNLRNLSEVDFSSLSQGIFFLFNDGCFMVTEILKDDEWTNAICIESPHCDSGHRCNFCLNTKVIPLSKIYIDYEI